MKKFNIYVICSNKFDYKEEFYKPLLLSPTVLEHNLVLPFTEKYQNMYAKSLVEDSDLVIINLSESTFSVFIETRWAVKMNKPILFLIKENTKCHFLLKKYLKQTQGYVNIEQETDIINDYIKKSIDEISSKDGDGTINLGSLD